jgi:hypothetical protein
MNKAAVISRLQRLRHWQEAAQHARAGERITTCWRNTFNSHARTHAHSLTRALLRATLHSRRRRCCCSGEEGSAASRRRPHTAVGPGPRNDQPLPQQQRQQQQQRPRGGAARAACRVGVRGRPQAVLRDRPPGRPRAWQLRRAVRRDGGALDGGGGRRADAGRRRHAAAGARVCEVAGCRGICSGRSPPHCSLEFPPCSINPALTRRRDRPQLQTGNQFPTRSSSGSAPTPTAASRRAQTAGRPRRRTARRWRRAPSTARCGRCSRRGSCTRCRCVESERLAAAPPPPPSPPPRASPQLLGGLSRLAAAPCAPSSTSHPHPISPPPPRPQLFNTVLSADGSLDPDVLAINSGSAALLMAGVPWGGPVG